MPITTPEQLIEFLQNKMSMRDIYQPAIIRYLILNQGRAHKRNLAIELLKNDELKIDYYERILMRWPKKTLEKHGICQYDQKTKDFVLHLQIDFTNQDEIAKIIQICDQKIQDWEKKTSHIPGDIRYQKLAEANGKCQLCGVSSQLRPLDIDHIIPKAKQNKNGQVSRDNVWMDVDDPRNLQVLCSVCNRGKRDQDQRDFRPSTQKLIRDKIPDEILASGRTPVIEILNDIQYKQALEEKLVEEYVEFLHAPTSKERCDELGDIYEVMLALVIQEGISEEDWFHIIQKKRVIKGSFTKRIYLKA